MPSRRGLTRAPDGIARGSGDGMELVENPENVYPSSSPSLLGDFDFPVPLNPPSRSSDSLSRSPLVWLFSVRLKIARFPPGFPPSFEFLARPTLSDLRYTGPDPKPKHSVIPPSRPLLNFKNDKISFVPRVLFCSGHFLDLYLIFLLIEAN